MRLLLVEDEPALGDAVAERLRRDGYVVDRAASLGEAFEAIMGASYRCVLLDRRLPDGDGLSLLPMLRTRAEAPPAMVLTALDDVPDRVAGLDAGAEDYLIKPFALDELLARLRVLLRRTQAAARPPEITIGLLTYAPGDGDIRIGGMPLSLSRRELAMFDTLARRNGRVVLREALEGAIYGYDDDVGPNALEAIASRLRRRLADAGAGVRIEGIRGVGYMIQSLSG